MQFFVDTAEIADIKKLYEMGLLDGVTTNPSLVAKSGRDFKEVIKEICATVPGPVSAEVAALDYDGMIAEGHVLAKLATNVVVKLPLTVDGLRACKTFTNEGIKTNVTLCFSPNQALLAAKCGATYVSPFLGRLDSHSEPRQGCGVDRRRCCHRAAGHPEDPRQASTDRQRPRSVPRRLEEERAEDRLTGG